MLPLEAAISPKLKALGFKKKARTWWRTENDSIQVVNLQKSPYGDQLYVNLALYIRSLGPERLPPENRCHIQARLERVVPTSLSESVTSASADSEASDALLQALLVHGIGWLEGIASPAGRKVFLAQSASAHCLIDARARAA